MKAILVKDKLHLLMIVCILSNIILAVFSIDYLRKMEWNAEKLYEQKLQSMQIFKSAEKLAALNQLDEAIALVEAEREQLAFDSKMDFYYGQLKSNASVAYFEEVANYVLERTEQQVKAYEKDIHKGYIWMLSVSLLMIVIVLSLSFIATKSVRKPTEQLKFLLQRAQDGDFTHSAKYEAKDELGDVLLSYNKMVTEVKSLLEVVNKSAQSVKNANDNLGESSETMTSSAHQIARRVDDVTSAIKNSTNQLLSNSSMIEEVAGSIDQITSRVQLVKGNVNETVQQAVTGEKQIMTNVKEMHVARQAMSKANDMMNKLETQSQEISQVVDIIQSIASETNLLALNAAIEAARAGTHGKGFGVVATEVKKLAQQSLDSTGTITEIVKSIQNDAKEAVQVMEEASEVVLSGIETTDETARYFQEIAKRIQDISPHMEEVTTTIEQMANYTKEVAEQSNEVASTAEVNRTQMDEISEKIEAQLEETKEIHNQIKQISRNTKSLANALNKFTV